MSNNTTVLTVLALAVALLSLQALAVPGGPDSISVGSSERANLDNTTKSTQAQAGNVTALNISQTTITDAWQGYYGNITGQITLEDAGGDVFYNWSGLNTLSGEVYASRNTSITWGQINCTNQTGINEEDSVLGKNGAEADSVNQTFNTQTHPSFQVGSRSVGTDSCFSTNAYSGNGQDTSLWHQILLSDNASKRVYTTLINDTSTAYDGSTRDFQLLVGENGNETSQESTQYNFYIELS